jgi:hypothetical protein
MKTRMAFRTSNQVSNLRPEQELIPRCIRAREDSANSERIQALLRGELNWTEVIGLTMQHRIAPFVYERLMTSDESAVPAAQQEVLRSAASHVARSSLVLLQELIRLHDLFAAENLPLIPHKGPVLAWLAYGNFTRREFTDLDFVVPQKSIPQATALLRRAGYREGFDLREAHDGKDGFAPGQYLFIRDEHAVQVELHTERTLRYFPVPLDIEDMGRRLIAVEIAGRTIHAFSVEETLVMLCVHGAKHFWERLSWILDIAELITAQPVDWERALDAAHKLRSTRLLLLGLDLAHEMLAAPLPQSVLEKIEEDSNVFWLAKRVRESYEGVSDVGANVLSRTAFRVRSRDALAQGIFHMLRLATVPTESDRAMIHLPQVFSPLYVLLRPWRLLREYGVGLRRRT